MSTPQLSPARDARVGDLPVRRALPTRGRRTVGGWCFLDHLGTATYREDRRYDVAPHPHIGLQTVTWLLEGGMVHRDSLGSEQLIRPGQLNLMSAGSGVVHAEENPGLRSGHLHGFQLWIAQPEGTRHAHAAFDHHADLPAVEVTNGLATVFMGQFAHGTSPARRDRDVVGVELRLSPGPSAVAIEPRFEHALVVATGEIVVEGMAVTPGSVAYLPPGGDEVALTATEDTVALLIGGAPLDDPVLMWWNFVGRSFEEFATAYKSYVGRDEPFGDVNSSLARVEAVPPPTFIERH